MTAPRPRARRASSTSTPGDGTEADAGASAPAGDGVRNSFAPVHRQSLSDTLARQIIRMIRSADYGEGDRLPSIAEMARSFGVGHPAVREALKKLETMRIVEIRHGSGVYVSRKDEVMVLASPTFSGTVTKKLMLDLVLARLPIEVQTASMAARNATEAHVAEMRRLLDTAGAHETDDAVLHSVNMAFHRQIAVASGNVVLAQLLDVLVDLFADEQRLILGIFSREQDHREHLGLLEAIERRDEALVVERMSRHLQGVHDAVLRWDPERLPVG